MYFLGASLENFHPPQGAREDPARFALLFGNALAISSKQRGMGGYSLAKARSAVI